MFNGIDSRSTILNIKYPENVPVVANLSNLEIKVANNTEEADVKKIEGENLLWPSSKAKIIPVNGALKATAKPALAPPVIANLLNALARGSTFSNTWSTPCPIWTLGPSPPNGKPAKKDINELRIVPTKTCIVLYFICPRITPSV